MSGNPSDGGGGASGPADDADGPAKAVQILETLRATEAASHILSGRSARGLR